MSSSPQSIVELVSSEVVRKLRLASEADTVEDREIVCEEVFLDISGILDDAARVQLGAPEGCPFYFVLAHYYGSPRGSDTAIAVMHLLQNLYGQGYAAPLVALLLHRWLLLRRSTQGGVPEEQRVRLANVMALGAVQLFVGDIQSGATLFRPMWRTLCYEVVLGELHSTPEGFKGLGPRPLAKEQQQRRQQQQGQQGREPKAPLQSHSLDWGDLPESSSPSDSEQQQQGTATPPPHPNPQQLPSQSPMLGQAAPGLVALPPAARNTLIAAAIGPLPYYAADPAEVKDVLQRVPPPYVHLHPATPPSAPPQPPPPPSFTPGAGADYALTEITDTLSRIRSEAGLLRYLTALRSLKGDPVLLVWPTTRLRLQSELYALTSPGGPHYPPRSVQAAALGVLDHLFPSNQTTRNIMRWVFKVLHPTDWLGGALLVPVQWASWAWGKVLLAFFWCLYSLVVFRRRGRRASMQDDSFSTAERQHAFARSARGGRALPDALATDERGGGSEGVGGGTGGTAPTPSAPDMKRTSSSSSSSSSSMHRDAGDSRQGTQTQAHKNRGGGSHVLGAVRHQAGGRAHCGLGCASEEVQGPLPDLRSEQGQGPGLAQGEGGALLGQQQSLEARHERGHAAPLQQHVQQQQQQQQQQLVHPWGVGRPMDASLPLGWHAQGEGMGGKLRRASRSVGDFVGQWLKQD